MEQNPSWEANRFLDEKVPAFCGTRGFITAFTSARHLSLSWVSSIQSIPPTSNFLTIYLNIILSSTPGSPKWSLSLRFPHQHPVLHLPKLAAYINTRSSYSVCWTYTHVSFCSLTETRDFFKAWIRLFSSSDVDLNYSVAINQSAQQPSHIEKGAPKWSAWLHLTRVMWILVLKLVRIQIWRFAE
jgi:hypothetical protein